MIHRWTLLTADPLCSGYRDTLALPNPREAVTTFIQVCALRSYCLGTGLTQPSLYSPGNAVAVLFTALSLHVLSASLTKGLYFSWFALLMFPKIVLYLGKEKELFLMYRDIQESRIRPFSTSDIPILVTSSQ